MTQSKFIREEHANSFSHFIGLVLAAIGAPFAVWMAWQSGRVPVTIAVAIWASCLVFTYAASMSYHGFQHPSLKNRLLIVDRISIFYLIAGCYTPFLVVYDMPHTRILLAIEWGLAIVGTLFNLRFYDRYNWVSLGIYLLMGWLGFMFGGEFFRELPMVSKYWMWACAAAYSIGVMFYLMRRIPHHHLIWHSFVILGSTFHYLGVISLLRMGSEL